MDVAERRTRAEQLRGREVRRVPAAALELRDAPDGRLTLSGVASVTERSYPMGWYEETIARGAFTETLARNPDVQLLINHEGLPLARTVGGSLRLSEDEQGLRFDATVDPADPDVQRLAPKVRAGLIDQCSFGFSGAKSEWDDDMTQRRIVSLDVHRGDVSVVNQGANPYTSFSMRSLDEWADTMTEEELAMALISLQKRMPAAPVTVETPPPAVPSLDTYRARAYALASRARG